MSSFFPRTFLTFAFFFFSFLFFCQGNVSVSCWHRFAVPVASLRSKSQSTKPCPLDLTVRSTPTRRQI